MSGSIQFSDIRVLVDPGAQYNVTVRSPNNFVIEDSDLKYRIADIASTANTASVALTALTASYLEGSGQFGAIDNVFYVSEDGVDSQDGKTIDTAFRTIKQATIAASASIAASPSKRISIHVKSGFYTEEAPITVPQNTSILGDDLRTVVVRPTSASATENLFLLNSGDYVRGLRLEGCEIDDLEDPTSGFFFAFAPNAVITTSPYIQNCSAIHTPADKFYVPLDSGSTPPNPLVGNGPGGMLVDDSVLNGYSPLKSMVVDAYTQVAFNGIGVCVRGAGYAQLVSVFTNFSRAGIYCLDGGHTSLLNSNTTFGDYGLRASGSRTLVVPDISSVSTHSLQADGGLITTRKQDILDYMIGELQLSGSYSSSYLDTGSATYTSTLTDAGLLLDSVARDLQDAEAANTSRFTQGLFKAQDISSGSIYTVPAPSGSSLQAVAVIPVNDGNALAGDFILSYEKMADYIVDDPDGYFTSMTANGKTKVGQLFAVPSGTLESVIINNEATLLQAFGSLITSTAHDFSYAGSGVNFLGLPPNQGGVGQTNFDLRVVEENGGRVFYTAGDETGDFFVGEGFIIRQETGIIEGRTFERALAARFTPINLALEDF